MTDDREALYSKSDRDIINRLARAEIISDESHILPMKVLYEIWRRVKDDRIEATRPILLREMEPLKKQLEAMQKERQQQ